MARSRPALRYGLAALLLGGCNRPQGTPPPKPQPNSNLQIRFVSQPAEPRQLDPTRFTVTLKDRYGRLVMGATIAVDLTMPAMDMGKNEVNLTSQAPGLYIGLGRFTMPGAWRATVTATHDSDRAVQSFPIRVQ